MNYLIKTEGEVQEVHIRQDAYVIEANSEEEAQEIAIKKFKKNYNSINEEVSLREMGNKHRNAILAIIFMSIALLISFIPFETERSFLFLIRWTETISLSPELISTLVGTIVYALFVIRFKGIKETMSSAIDITLCVLSIFLFSSILNLSLLGDEMKLFSIIPIPKQVIYLLLLLGTIFTWMKMKLLGIICIITTTLISVANICVYSEAMGIFGVIYAISAFLGFMYHLSIEPQVLIRLPGIWHSVKKKSANIKEEFVEAGNEIKEVADKIKDIFKL